jgi:hypothetical protein
MLQLRDVIVNNVAVWTSSGRIWRRSLTYNYPLRMLTRSMPIGAMTDNCACETQPEKIANVGYHPLHKSLLKVSGTSCMTRCSSKTANTDIAFVNITCHFNKGPQNDMNCPNECADFEQHVGEEWTHRVVFTRFIEGFQAKDNRIRQSPYIDYRLSIDHRPGHYPNTH